MHSLPTHRVKVLGTPWQGVYYTEIESAQHFGKHWHGTHGMGVMDYGSQISASGRGQVQAYAGDVITTNPGEVHDGRPAAQDVRRWRMVYVEPKLLASSAHAPCGLPLGDTEFTHPVINDPGVRQKLNHLFTCITQWNAHESPCALQTLGCDEALVQACNHMPRNHVRALLQGEDAPVQMQRIRDWLADAMSNPPSLTELARSAGISKYQVIRHFEKVFHVSPYVWLVHQRVEQARKLIARGMGLTQAAYAVGFADQSHMTRMFKRHLGFTPGVWQKATVQ